MRGANALNSADLDLDELAVLADADRLYPDVLDALSVGLPPCMLFARQADPLAGHPGQLVHGDVESVGDGYGYREHRLLLACFVSPDLARVYARGFG